MVQLRVCQPTTVPWLNHLRQKKLEKWLLQNHGCRAMVGPWFDYGILGYQKYHIAKYFVTSGFVRTAGHYVGSPVPAFRPSPTTLLPVLVRMRAGTSAPTPVFIASAHCQPALVCAPLACPVPNLPAVAHGRPVPRETKNANFCTPLPHFWHLKPSVGHPGAIVKIWRWSPFLFQSNKRTNIHT